MPADIILMHRHIWLKWSISVYASEPECKRLISIYSSFSISQYNNGPYKLFLVNHHAVHVMCKWFAKTNVLFLIVTMLTIKNTDVQSLCGTIIVNNSWYTLLTTAATVCINNSVFGGWSIRVGMGSIYAYTNRYWSYWNCGNRTLQLYWNILENKR